MNKVLLGIVVGAVLGVLDGLTALFHGPKFQEQIAGIVLGSTFKGVIAGIAAGFFARKYRSVPLGIAFGLVVGLALAAVIAKMASEENHENLYLAIMLPGGIAGALVGWATQRYGRSPA